MLRRLGTSWSFTEAGAGEPRPGWSRLADGLWLPPDVVAGARRQAVLGKVGSPDNIADATVLLCRVDTMTGQTIVVDAGMP